MKTRDKIGLGISCLMAAGYVVLGVEAVEGVLQVGGLEAAGAIASLIIPSVVSNIIGSCVDAVKEKSSFVKVGIFPTDVQPAQSNVCNIKSPQTPFNKETSKEKNKLQNPYFTPPFL